MTSALELNTYDESQFPIEFPPADFEPGPQLSLIQGTVEIVEPAAEATHEPLTVERAYQLGVYDGIYGHVRNEAAVSLGYRKHPTNIYTAKTRW